MVDPYAIVRRLTGHELISPKDARLLTEAVDGLIGEIGSKDARIAELEAENERLKNLVGDPEGTVAHAEAFLARAEHAEAALAAKDAELAVAVEEIERLKNLVGDPQGTVDHAEAFLARAERAETELTRRDMQLEASAKVALDLSDQLAETRKALNALDRMNRGLDWCDQDEQARRWAAARRALTGGRDDA